MVMYGMFYIDLVQIVVYKQGLSVIYVMIYHIEYVLKCILYCPSSS